MATKDYSLLSREELISLLMKYDEKKKYGIVWDEERVPEKVVTDCQTHLPVLTEVKDKEIITNPNELTHLLIEGDNYHTLSVLNYTHAGKIDLIYIDPPYNTGNKDFIYNDKYVESEDDYKHSKWLNFMSKRLELARELLTQNGVIFISIDDNEVAQLKILCDKIFDEKNLIGLVTVAKGTTTGQDARKMGSSVDYLLVYGKDNFQIGKLALTEKDIARFNNEDEKGKYSILQFRKTGNNDRRENRPNLFYALKDPNGKECYPMHPDGYESTWRGNMANFKKLEKENMVVWKERDGVYKPYIKFYLEGRGKSASNLWNDIDGNKKATIEIKEIFGDKIFNNPKPTDLIKKCIELANVTNPIVLDFFAGSGTTGHAILKMNEQNNTKMQFILCTNNENNICESITYPRIQKGMIGYTNNKGEEVEGLGGNLKYFKTSFVENTKNKDQVKANVTRRCTEMLCVKEGVYNLIKESLDWKIFEQNGNYLAVYYELSEIELDELKKEMNAINGDKVLYCFTTEREVNQNDFEDWDNTRIETIPQKILDVYRRIFTQE